MDTVEEPEPQYVGALHLKEGAPPPVSGALQLVAGLHWIAGVDPARQPHAGGRPRVDETGTFATRYAAIVAAQRRTWAKGNKTPFTVDIALAALERAKLPMSRATFYRLCPKEQLPSAIDRQFRR